MIITQDSDNLTDIQLFFDVDNLISTQIFYSTNLPDSYGKKINNRPTKGIERFKMHCLLLRKDSIW